MRSRLSVLAVASILAVAGLVGRAEATPLAAPASAVMSEGAQGGIMPVRMTKHEMMMMKKKRMMMKKHHRRMHHRMMMKHDRM